MPVIKKPAYDANGMMTGYVDYTTTNNTATGWGGRRKKKALASNQYPNVNAYVTTTNVEPV